MSKELDIREFVPISQIAKQAILDTYADYESSRLRYEAWAIRGLKKLTKQTLRSDTRRAILHINNNTKHAILPCDFKRETFVGFIDECGLKVPININPRIVNMKMIDEVGCENECDKNCGCYPKQLCRDLETTQTINKIRINDTDYDETVTATLQPNGEYYVVRTTPFLSLDGGGVEYRTTKEYVTTFDVADCGCIEQTERNKCRLENVCWDAYCCYCTGCTKSDTSYGGYRIFPENNIIQFDRSICFDKAYIEYIGFLPKEGNEYLVPEIAFEVLVNFTKFKSVENKKGVSRSDKEWHWGRYLIEYENMKKNIGRMSLSDILHSALKIPKFEHVSNGCYIPCFTPKKVKQSSSSQSSSDVVTTPTAPSQSSGCNPAIITTNGQEMESGKIYHNHTLMGVPIRVFANTFNRYLRDDEIRILSSGGFEVLIAPPQGYTVYDEFDIFPKWCDANTDNIPSSVIIGARKLAIKVDGNAGSPVDGEYTFQSNDLIGAQVIDIFVNKMLETAIDGDFTFDSTTGIITRTQVWQAGPPPDTGIINYIK